MSLPPYNVDAEEKRGPLSSVANGFPVVSAFGSWGLLDLEGTRMDHVSDNRTDPNPVAASGCPSTRAPMNEIP